MESRVLPMCDPTTSVLNGLATIILHSFVSKEEVWPPEKMMWVSKGMLKENLVSKGNSPRHDISLKIFHNFIITFGFYGCRGGNQFTQVSRLDGRNHTAIVDIFEIIRNVINHLMTTLSEFCS